MTTNEGTLRKLQRLETLYQRGYRSEVVDRSLGKIVELEQNSVQRELQKLTGRLQEFEEQYAMVSNEFYRRFRSGELGDAADYVEWSIFYEMRESVQERLDVLNANLAR